jgi:hypothetical protein
MGQLGGKRFVPVSSEQILDYQEAYQKWLETVADFLREFGERINACSALPWIEIGLTNMGTTPAMNVDVRVEVMGDGFSIFAPGKEMEKVLAEPFRLPAMPPIPKGRWVEPLALGASLLSKPFHITPPSLDFLRHTPSVDVNKFYWKDGRPTEPVQQISRVCSVWRHQDDTELLKLRLYLDKPDDLPKGAIRVIIRATNLSQPVQSTQPIRLEGVELDLLPEAETLIDRF